MSASHTTTTTTTSSSTAGPLRSRPILPLPTSPANHKDEDDKEEIMRKAQEWVHKVRDRKVAEAAKRKAKEEAARKAAEEEEKKKKKEAAARAGAAKKKVAQEVRERANWAQQEEEETVGRHGDCQNPMGNFTQQGSKKAGKAKAQLVGGDPNNGNNGNDNDNDKEDKEPCKQCKAKKIPCQMQAGKRSSIICKSCHNTKKSTVFVLWSALNGEVRRGFQPNCSGKASQKEEFAPQNAGSQAIGIAKEMEEDCGQ
ncbi:hypothetical protein F5877DRAFT_80436 [Lentinula edodes]|nr:hypothetical protein F5877DRAFT_80436 [Lentinula edodes]